MKNISIWNGNNKKNYPKLEEDKKVDVLIIGGGMSGVSTLYHLRDSNLKVMLVEQNKIASSTTGNSTGKLSFLQNDLINNIRNKYDDEIASIYLKSQMDAINRIVNTIDKEHIKCNLEKVDSYLYTNNKDEIDKIKQLESFLNKNNISIYHDSNNIVKSKYSINVKDTYIFNPVEFINGLLKKNKHPIYEDTSIINIEYKDNIYLCYTTNNIIKANYVVLATHYPYFTIPYLFPFKVSLEKSYLSASKKKIKPFSLISYSNPFISIRTYKNYLIYLSNSHSINKDSCDNKNYQELLKKINDLDLEPDYLWCNIDIMTSDYLPIIGRLKNNIFIATGYNTWGLANGFLAGSILSNLILNKENEYEIFDPNRSGLISTGNILKSVGGYIEGFTNGTKYNCPHLSCKLIYNEINNTFDCPCHGSRFDKDGKCIMGPANRDIDIDKDFSH